MSWIKDNKFLVALGGATLVGAVLLLLVGSKGSGRYAQAKEDFETARSEVASYARLPLYPSAENRDGKSKASMNTARMSPRSRPPSNRSAPKPSKISLPRISPTTSRPSTTRSAPPSRTPEPSVPEAFFCGFENYKTSLASGNATGILDYQLAGIKKLMLELAKSGAAEFKNLHRPALPEEEGREYQPAATDAARPLARWK